MFLRTNITYSENVKMLDIIFNDSDIQLCEIPSCDIQLIEIVMI